MQMIFSLAFKGETEAVCAAGLLLAHPAARLEGVPWLSLVGSGCASVAIVLISPACPPPGTAIPSHGGRSSATSVVEPPERTRGYICPPCSAVAWSGCCGAGAGWGGCSGTRGASLIRTEMGRAGAGFLLLPWMCPFFSLPCLLRTSPSHPLSFPRFASYLFPRPRSR